MTGVDPAFTLSWVDWALLAVLAVSVVVGLWRGLIFEVLSLIGWVAAYVAAQVLSPTVAPWLPIGTPDSAVNSGAAFAITFVLALMVWSLVARLVSLLVKATPLAFVDRVLGAGFGLMRGGVLLLALATVVALTPAARSPQWQESVGAAWLGAMLQELKPVLPVNVARHLPG
ncbi:MAG: CvpA family protein [Aquincola tertiaricarbonis]|uniref:CvpA family protein n=1 Tax=Aquincola TaxID=391952 RepID=UPI000695E441|nr:MULTISPECIES: CvpA family protein [Aquincola]MCR5865298.1 CvpA family protein [Aquincola sp. J276]